VASTPARVPLTLERIVDTAIAVIDSEGTAAVTMRRMAGDLGVVPSSLYVHVRSRDELLLLALEHVLEEIGLPEITGTWDEVLRRHFTNMQRGLSAHGDIALYNFAAFPPTAIGVATTERLLATLLDADVPPRVATWALHRLTLYTTADVYEGWHLATQGAKTWIGPARDYFQSLPAEQFPAIARSVGFILDSRSDDRFQLGLSMLISGIASFIPKQTTSGEAVGR
jgi:AcrR family transcriptional regulator